MTRRLITTGAVAVFTVTLLSTTTASGATTSNTGNYGHHVVSCAQSVGFDGSHNPGMHHGFSGWTPHHECAM